MYFWHIKKVNTKKVNFPKQTDFCTFAVQNENMGRILAIDYGQKRVGLAVTDPLQIAANGLDTISVSEVLDYLKRYIEKEPIEKFVVGLPKQMNGEDSDSMQFIRPFVENLRRKFPNIELVYVDERFTSILAHKAMLEGGLKKKDRQNKGLVDKISATIILQTYLETIRHSMSIG